MKPLPASGRASALRYNLAASSTTIFKTRNAPCRIAVRAEIKKSINFNKNRCGIAVRWTSRGVDQRRNMPFSRPILRFTDDCQLKSADSQPRCDLRFPYGTGRVTQTGFLNKCLELRLGGLAQPQAHSAQRLTVTPGAPYARPKSMP